MRYEEEPPSPSVPDFGEDDGQKAGEEEVEEMTMTGAAKIDEDPGEAGAVAAKRGKGHSKAGGAHPSQQERWTNKDWADWRRQRSSGREGKGGEHQPRQQRGRDDHREMRGDGG